MRPNVKISYDKKFDSIADVEPTDITAILADHLPPVAFQTEKDFVTATKGIAETFTPPGQLIKTFGHPSGPYEIWKGSLADPAVKKLMMRIQLMVLFYIEAGSPIVHEETPDWENARWTVYFLYQKKWLSPEKDASRHTFIGCSTVYRFLTMIPSTSPGSSDDAKKEFELDTKSNFALDTLPCRLRISQFLILPPFLHQGNGGRLYRTVYADLLADDACQEITVEDPNEAFDELRDYNDLAFIRTLPEMDNIKINLDFQPKGKDDSFHIVDSKAVETLKNKTKITKRQLGRLIEMHLMAQLPKSVRPALENDREPGGNPLPTPLERKRYGLWKRLVKARLYRHNMDTLKQLEKEERIEKLEEVLRSVEFEYIRLLGLSKSRAIAAAPARTCSPNLTPTKVNGGKRPASEGFSNKERCIKKVRTEDSGNT